MDSIRDGDEGELGGLWWGFCVRPHSLALYKSNLYYLGWPGPKTGGGALQHNIGVVGWEKVLGVCLLGVGGWLVSRRANTRLGTMDQGHTSAKLQSSRPPNTATQPEISQPNGGNLGIKCYHSWACDMIQGL